MQAAQNADISKSNDQALKYAELTNTRSPPMRLAVGEEFPEPVPPQPPVSGRQQAAAGALMRESSSGSDCIRSGKPSSSEEELSSICMLTKISQCKDAANTGHCAQLPHTACSRCRRNYRLCGKT